MGCPEVSKCCCLKSKHVWSMCTSEAGEQHDLIPQVQVNIRKHVFVVYINQLEVSNTDLYYFVYFNDH